MKLKGVRVAVSCRLDCKPKVKVRELFSKVRVTQTEMQKLKVKLTAVRINS